MKQAAPGRPPMALTIEGLGRAVASLGARHVELAGVGRVSITMPGDRVHDVPILSRRPFSAAQWSVLRWRTSRPLRHINAALARGSADPFTLLGRPASAGAAAHVEALPGVKLFVLCSAPHVLDLADLTVRPVALLRQPPDGATAPARLEDRGSHVFPAAGALWELDSSSDVVSCFARAPLSWKLSDGGSGSVVGSAPRPRSPRVGELLPEPHVGRVLRGETRVEKWLPDAWETPERQFTGLSRYAPSSDVLAVHGTTGGALTVFAGSRSRPPAVFATDSYAFRLGRKGEVVSVASAGRTRIFDTRTGESRAETELRAGVINDEGTLLAGFRGAEVAWTSMDAPRGINVVAPLPGLTEEPPTFDRHFEWAPDRNVFVARNWADILVVDVEHGRYMALRTSTDSTSVFPVLPIGVTGGA